MPIHFRHDSMRPYQAQLVQDIHEAISNHNNIMVQAPTGMGKTDAALSATISYATENNLNVFFLTPKISQHRIAVEVVNGIAKKHGLDVRGVDIIGRSHCCIENPLLDLDHDAFMHACAKRRKRKECIYYGNARGYDRLGEAKANLRFKKVLSEYGAAKDHNEMVKLGILTQSCPYELLMKLAELSNVVIADYYHLMIPEIREVFMLKIKKRIEDSIIIIDEAHNLASRVRDSLSIGISNFTLKRMEKEMRYLKMDAGPVDEEFTKWANEMLRGDPVDAHADPDHYPSYRAKNRERAVSVQSFEDYLSRFGMDRGEIVKRLGDAGMEIIEQTGKKSACLRLSRFIALWGDESQECVRVLKRKGDFFFLSKRLLDPTSATRVLNECASSVLMSGSLLPLEMHRDILGLDPNCTLMRSYPSPFASGNIVNIITPNLTSRYTRRGPEEFDSMAKRIDGIISNTPGGTAVFFPSYNVMDSVLPRMGSRDLHAQKSGMKPHEIRKMIKDFKCGGTLCGVQGGSLSEGVDFNEGEIKTVVVVGVALDEMDIETRALIDYYDQKFSRGWDYGYIYPGTIKALQAAGRGRRKESDRVAVVYMDERFRWGKYNWILNKDERIVITEAPEDEVGRFWSK